MAAVEGLILGVAPSTLAAVVSRAALDIKVADIRDEEGFRDAMASKVAAMRRRVADRGPGGVDIMLMKVPQIPLVWGMAPILCKAKVVIWGP
jgi:hypothetical protein